MLLIVILAIGAALRLYNNIAVALWHDEAFSALYLGYNWGEMIHRIILDVHPPLYYFALRLWSYGFGASLLSLRMLSIVFGVLTIWAGYKFLRAAFQNQKFALVGALLIALNPFQIQYALEARMYTLGTFLILLSSYFLVKAIDRSETKSRRYWIYYAVAAAAALYTHYYLLFSVAAQGIFVLLSWWRSRNGRILANGILSYILAFVLYLPWLPSFIRQARQVQENFWIPPASAWSIPGTVWKMFFAGPGVERIWLAISTVLAVLLLVYFLKKAKSHHKWHVFFGILIPFLGAIALSISSNLYLDRYFVFASLYFTIAAAGAFYYIPKRALSYFLLVIFALASLFGFWSNWRNLDINDKPGMAAASQIVNNNAEAEDKIYAASSFIYFTFKYYNETGIEPRLISTLPLEEIPHFSGTAILKPEDLVLNLDNAESGETVWLLWTTGFGGSKPEVPSNWIQIGEDGFQDAPDFKGWITVTEYAVN